MSSKTFYQRNALFCFVDYAELSAEINALPERKAQFDKISQKCTKAIERIVEAYVKEARRIMKDVPAAYCRMSEYVGVMDIFVKVPDSVPVVDMANISVDVFGNGNRTLISFESGISYPDNKEGVFVPKLIKDRGTEQLDESLKLLKETESITLVNDCLRVTLFEGLDEKEQSLSIQTVINKHLLRGEKKIRAWLDELGQYADPGGLFGAML